MSEALEKVNYAPGRLVRMAKNHPFGPRAGTVVRLLGIQRRRVWAVAVHEIHERYGDTISFWAVYNVQQSLLGDVVDE